MVAERWLRAYPGKLDKPQFAKQRELKKQAIMGDKNKLKQYRKRLGSLSWFMGRLNEPLAKQSDEEEFCTGRFWQGRYSSQALLDEAAVFSCMTYVDLNPIRAKITETIEQLDHTSIKKRINHLQKLDPTRVESTLEQSIAAITDELQEKIISMSLKNYIELVEWTGQSIVHPNKAKLPPHIASSLSTLNLQQNHWLKQIENFNQNYCHIVGPVEQIRTKAKELKLRCMKGISAAKLLYEKT